MIIPVVIALAAASSGAVVGFAAFASIAGAMMVAGGTLMGDKDLTKIGAIIGVVGGISGFASGASSASNIDSAAKAGDYVNAADAASDAVTAGNAAATSSPVTGDAMGAVADTGSTNMFNGAEKMEPPPNYGSTIAEQAAAANTAPATNTTSLADMAAKSGLAAPDAGTTGLTPAQANYAQLEQTTQLPTTPLEKAASGYSSSDLEAWWQKAKTAGKDVGKFVEDNKTLVKIGGDMLGSMYGPQAEALDYQKSLMERARRNINAPVVLKYQPQGVK